MKKRLLQTVSVLTLTYNRAPLLEKNFSSLIGQLSDKDEIIVINNSSTDHTKQVIEKYKKILPIKNFTAKKGASYGKLYNLAVEKSSKDILIFFDDDCIASKNFIAAIKKAHHLYPRSLLQGLTYSLPKKNIYAEVMGNHYQNWLKSNLIDESNRLKTFDNKNASISRSILFTKYKFNEKLVFGSEDIDLGFRLQKDGIIIQFEPSIVAYHHERSTFKQFLLQHVRIAKSEAILDENEDKKLVIGFIPKRLKYHILSFFDLEWQLIKEKRIKDSLLHPFLNLLLVATRIYGYAQKK